MSSVSWTASNLGNFQPQQTAPVLSVEEQVIADRFHDLYYSKLDEGRGLHTVVLSWMGYEMFKCPMDLWTYQEIIFSIKPDIIVETGTYKGGSALYLSSICDQVGHGEVISIDIDETHSEIRPKHPRITYIVGSSTEPSVLSQVKARCRAGGRVLIILDSDHRSEHVLHELRLYSDLVGLDDYIIVEDTNINGHPTYPEFGPGPMEALEEFLASTSDFISDRSRERFILTMNPKGFLRRVRLAVTAVDVLPK